MPALIQIPANDIRVEGVDVDVELSPAWLDSVLSDARARCRRGHEGGRLSGRLSRSGNDIVVRARVVAEVELPCVRCLEPAAFAVGAELSLLLQPVRAGERGGARRPAKAGDRRRRGSPGAAQPAGEYEFSANEADLDTYDGETVVLDHLVREAILLEVPTFPLCSEACPGIRPAPPSPEPGVSLADSRWAPLRAFRSGAAGAASGAAAQATLDDLVAAAAVRSQAIGRKPMLRASGRPAVAKKRKRGK
jgi:uncharacterized protein